MVVRSGKGSIGKIAIWHKDMGVANASQHVDLVRTQGINPYWIAAFLKSKYGQIQIEQLETGVSRMTHLTYDDIRRFIIPVVSDTIQQSTQRRYLQMLQFHDAAMEAKVSGDESEYREKLTYAEKLLTELIEYVENTIYMGPQAETSVQEQP
jgi:restriction endonuclease S subunit